MTRKRVGSISWLSRRLPWPKPQTAAGGASTAVLRGAPHAPLAVMTWREVESDDDADPRIWVCKPFKPCKAMELPAMPSKPTRARPTWILRTSKTPRQRKVHDVLARCRAKAMATAHHDSKRRTKS